MLTVFFFPTPVNLDFPILLLNVTGISIIFRSYSIPNIVMYSPIPTPPTGLSLPG